MKNLTEYEKTMFLNLETLSMESGWFNIQPTRTDLERFVEAIRRRIDYHNDFEFNGDYTKFRRIKPFVVPRFIEITFKIEYDDHLVQLPYDHLPEPKYTEESKKVKRRAT